MGLKKFQFPKFPGELNLISTMKYQGIISPQMSKRLIPGTCQDLIEWTENGLNTITLKNPTSPEQFETA